MLVLPWYQVSIAVSLAFGHPIGAWVPLFSWFQFPPLKS
jgi:hypothetical protein